MKATFKRDYARVNPLLDAATALQQIAGWFEDCNESHPHSCLGMSSPREFIRTHLVLLCHKFRYLFRAAQHGQRDSIVARATTNRRRIVAIEFGTWRSGRNGGCSGLVTFA